MIRAVGLAGLFSAVVVAMAGCRGDEEAAPTEFTSGGMNDGGAGGAGDELGGGAGSSNDAGGGGGVSATCESCGDGDACNGEERCSQGECLEGLPVVCDQGLTCVAATGSCEYATPSPWLVYVGNDEAPSFLGLYGIPSAQIGQSAPLHLSAAVESEEYLGVGTISWSPDGRYLLFDLVRSDFTNRLFWIELSAGLPSAAQPIADLPSLGAWLFAGWSPDSRVAVLTNLNESGQYLADFTTGTPVASYRADAANVGFCADSSWLVYANAVGDVFLVERGSNDVSAPVGNGSFSISPDGERWLLEAGAESQLADCAPQATPRDTTLAAVESLTWSADGRYFAYISGYALTVVDATTGEPAWSGDVSEGAVRWSPSGARILVDVVDATTGDDPEVLWRILDFSAGQVSELALPFAPSTARWVPGGIELGSQNAETLEESAWLVRVDTGGVSEPLLLPGCAPLYATFAADGTLAACIRPTGDQLQIRALEVGESSVVARDLLDLPVSGNVTEWGFSPDRRGIVFHRRVSAEQDFSYLWWFATPDLSGPKVINTGDFAHFGGFDTPWQPAR